MWVFLQWGAKNPVLCLGKCEETIWYGEKSSKEEIHVLEGEFSGPCLLSNVTAQVMGLLAMTCNVTTDHHILKQYTQLFTGLGKLKDKAITLHINEAIKPVAQTHRSVPVHLQMKVEKEINSLLEQDIIEPVSGPTPWISPIVAVPKRDTEDIRICVDMKNS